MLVREVEPNRKKSVSLADMLSNKPPPPRQQEQEQEQEQEEMQEQPRKEERPAWNDDHHKATSLPLQYMGSVHDDDDDGHNTPLEGRRKSVANMTLAMNLKKGNGSERRSSAVASNDRRGSSASSDRRGSSGGKTLMDHYSVSAPPVVVEQPSQPQSQPQTRKKSVTLSDFLINPSNQQQQQTNKNQEDLWKKFGMNPGQSFE